MIRELGKSGLSLEIDGCTSQCVPDCYITGCQARGGGRREGGEWKRGTPADHVKGEGLGKEGCAGAL